MAQKNETRRIRRYDLLPVVTVDGFVCLPISFLANCVREKKKNGGRVGRQEDETCVTSECQEDEEASVEMVSSCLRTHCLSLDATCACLFRAKMQHFSTCFSARQI